MRFFPILFLDYLVCIVCTFLNGTRVEAYLAVNFQRCYFARTKHSPVTNFTRCIGLPLKLQPWKITAKYASDRVSFYNAQTVQIGKYVDLGCILCVFPVHGSLTYQHVKKNSAGEDSEVK